MAMGNVPRLSRCKIEARQRWHSKLVLQRHSKQRLGGVQREPAQEREPAKPHTPRVRSAGSLPALLESVACFVTAPPPKAGSNSRVAKISKNCRRFTRLVVARSLAAAVKRSSPPFRQCLETVRRSSSAPDLAATAAPHARHRLSHDAERLHPLARPPRSSPPSDAPSTRDAFACAAAAAPPLSVTPRALRVTQEARSVTPSEPPFLLARTKTSCQCALDEVLRSVGSEGHETERGETHGDGLCASGDAARPTHQKSAGKLSPRDRSLAD